MSDGMTDMSDGMTKMSEGMTKMSESLTLAIVVFSKVLKNQY